jgi:hypothetical protein
LTVFFTGYSVAFQASMDYSCVLNRIQVSNPVKMEQCIRRVHHPVLKGSPADFQIGCALFGKRMHPIQKKDVPDFRRSTAGVLIFIIPA